MKRIFIAWLLILAGILIAFDKGAKDIVLPG